MSCEKRAHSPRSEGTARYRSGPGFADEENEDNGAKRGKEGICEGRGRWVDGWRKVRLEKKRRVNGGGCPDHGRWNQEGSSEWRG